jgi:hypothetical protein
MKFINDIDLSVPSDVNGKNIQDRSDTFELSMAVQLRAIFDSISPATNSDNGTARQTLLNSFDVYAADAFEDFNAYRNTLYSINPNVNSGGLAFPETLPLTVALSTEETSKASARNGPGNKRVLRKVDGTIDRTSGTRGSGILEYDVWITPYESYIKNTNGTLTYYRWQEVTRKDNDAFVEYIDKVWGTTVYT